VPETVALHHEDAGPEDGHVVLMGASLGTTVAMWDEQVAPLAERFRVVRFDHRGHGGSPVVPGPYTIAEMGGDVVALLDSLGVERASFAGLSIGGMVAIWVAANAPERVERLALVCTAAHLPPPEGWEERAAEVDEAGTVEVVLEGVMARWLTPEYAAAHPEAVDKLSGMLAATSPEAYAACCRALGTMDLRDDVGRIRAPTLVVSGAQDPSTPPEHGEAIAAAIPGARYELLDPSAHIAAIERAGDVTRLLLDHLAPAA
jgi:3-oxoadipate enol-lactonase